WKFEEGWSSTDWGQLLWHGGVMLLLAAERFAAELRSSEPCPLLVYAFPLDVIEETAALIRHDERVLDRLKVVMVPSWRQSQPTAASLLHATGIGWRPEPLAISGFRKFLAAAKVTSLRLCGAYLEKASWPEILLRRAELADVNLSGADLKNADL